jgi:hypothetical protein
MVKLSLFVNIFGSKDLDNEINDKLNIVSLIEIYY